MLLVSVKTKLTGLKLVPDVLEYLTSYPIIWGVKICVTVDMDGATIKAMELARVAGAVGVVVTTVVTVTGGCVMVVVAVVVIFVMLVTVVGAEVIVVGGLDTVTVVTDVVVTSACLVIGT